MSKKPPPPRTRKRRDSFNIFYESFAERMKDIPLNEANLKSLAENTFTKLKAKGSGTGTIAPVTQAPPPRNEKAAHLQKFLEQAKKSNSGLADLNDTTLKQLAESNWENAQRRPIDIAAFLKEAGVSEGNAAALATNAAANITSRRLGERPLPPLETANLFEVADIKNSGQNIHTLEGLDAYIGYLFPEKLGEESHTFMGYTLGDRMGDLCPIVGEGVCAWKPIDTEGQGNDCMINSFLLTGSRNFRRLPIDYKNVVARSFRKHVYGKFLIDDGHVDQKYIKDVVFGKQFLSDFDMNILYAKYKRDLIVFETEKKEKVDHIKGGKRTTITESMPPTVVYPGLSNSDRVSVIFNKGNYHYEAVVVEKKGGALTLTIPKATAREIIQTVTALRYKPEERFGCKFQEGDHVQYKGGQYYVIQRSMEPPDCVGYRLTTEDQWPKFDALSRAEKDSTSAQEKYTAIKVGREQVVAVKAAPVARGGATRRLRRSRRAIRSRKARSKDGV